MFSRMLSKFTSILMVIAFAIMAIMPLSASPSAQDFTLPADGYFLSKDADGIMQLWRLSAETLEAQQITDITTPIIEYTISADETKTAYVSGGWLWVMDINGDNATQLAKLETQYLSTPVFSPDGESIAYANNGIAIVNIQTGENRQLLEDVPLDMDAGNMKEFRIYFPDRFSDDGTLLYVNAGVWEWLTAGLLDLETGELREVEPYIHTEIQRLDDGRIMSYGNTPVGGEWDIRIWNNALTEVEQRFDLRDLFTQTTLFIDHAIQLDDELYRFTGWTFEDVNNEPAHGQAYFDFDLSTGEVVGELVRFVLPVGQGITSSIPSTITTEGTVVIVYRDSEYDTELNNAGILTGYLAFTNITTGQTITVDTLNPVASFKWAR